MRLAAPSSRSLFRSGEPDIEVAVIGAGLAGLGAGIQLARAGIPFLLLEKAHEVGGTWKVNTYPGVAVDVDSFNYSYSFARHFAWTRAYAPGAEVAAYSEHLADAYGLRKHIRFGTEVLEARWDDERHTWRLSLAGGAILTCRFLLHAPGGLTQPKRPDIAGLEDFRGPLMHTARWDKRVDLKGKRVAVIGTGASAVQVIPSIAPDVAHLTVFQRTPVWVFPKRDFTIPGWMRTVLRRVPGAFEVVRRATGLPSLVAFRIGTIYSRQLPMIRRGVERYARVHLRRQVHDPALRDALTPRYGFGCKRPVVSNDYLTSYNRPNVSLVSEAIERVTGSGIRTKDGTLHEVDVVILATGFKVFEMGNTPPYPVHGLRGFELGRFWQEQRYQAYEACTLPQWPNSFLLGGPYGLGGPSYLAMIEAATRHALRVILAARKRGATYAAVRQSAHDRYFSDIQRRMNDTVFRSGACSGSNSYYFDGHGDAVATRPHVGAKIWWRSRFSRLDHYEFHAFPHAAASPSRSSGSRRPSAVATPATPMLAEEERP
jgi:cation diffusion facilitator CzcD-associated flavoprotein CzcO